MRLGTGFGYWSGADMGSPRRFTRRITVPGAQSLSCLVPSEDDGTQYCRIETPASPLIMTRSKPVMSRVVRSISAGSRRSPTSAPVVVAQPAPAALLSPDQALPRCPSTAKMEFALASGWQFALKNWVPSLFLRYSDGTQFSSDHNLNSVPQGHRRPPLMAPPRRRSDIL